MRKTKIILLMLVMFLFSGCTVNYDLYINDDLTVNEKVTAIEFSNTLNDMTGQDPEAAAKSLLDNYKIDGVKYSTSVIKSNDSITAKASTSFKSLEEYSEYFTSDIVEEAYVTKKGDIVTLEYNQDVALDNYSSRTLMYDDIIVTITVPFKVVENNADKKQGNTYTWNITRDGNKKNIKIKFDTSKTNTYRKFNFGFFKVDVKYSFLLVFGIVVVILLIVLYVYIKNKKNNKI